MATAREPGTTAPSRAGREGEWEGGGGFHSFGRHPGDARAAADRLLAALARSRDAFAADDAISASTCLDAVVAACAELQRAGARLDDETLEHARALHRACALAALEAQRVLNEKLEQAGDARRAVRAYGG